MNINKVRLYYLSFNLYNFSSGLISVFLNLFVIATASLIGVLYFNMFYYAGIEIFYFATIYALGHLEPKDMYIIGVCIRALALILLMAAATFVSNIAIFGFLYGASIGTFWLGNNILTSDVSKEMDQKDFVLKISVIGNIVGLVAPVAAGIMIQYSQFAGPLRFSYDFGAAVIVLLACAYTLSIIKFPKESNTTKYGIVERIKYKGYKYFKIYYLLSNMFLIPFSIVLPIYVFLITNSYIITGIYGSMILVLTLFSNYLTKIDRKHWNAFLKISVAASIFSSLLLFPNYLGSLTSIFIFTIIYTIFTTPLQNQSYSNFLEMIERSKIDRIHFWINREYYITTGRIVAFVSMALAFIYFGSDIIYLIYIMPFMSIYCLIYLKSSVKAMQA